MKGTNSQDFATNDFVKSTSRFFITLLFFVTLFFVLNCSKSAAQTNCCLTTTLTINTGYNPTTGSAITPGANGATPVPDSEWTVGYYPSSVSTAAAYGCPTPHCTPAISSFVVTGYPGQPADVVYSCCGAITSTASNPISCMNTNQYHSDLTGPSGTIYYMDLYRQVCLCKSSAITYDMNISTDNGVDIYFNPSSTPTYSVGASPSLYYLNPGSGFVASNWTTWNNFSYTTSTLSPGCYKILIRVYQFNHPPADSTDPNATYLNVTGTVTSSVANALISESSACASYTCLNPISGASTVCVGKTITLSDLTTGGTWSSSNAGIGSVGATGVVGGVSAGTVTITYTHGGCYVTHPVTVNPTPTISGLDTVCIGSTITLTTTVSGGTWSSSNSGIASVGSSSGVVTGVATGYAIISYILPTGCFDAKEVLVPVATNILGVDPICAGETVTWDSYPSYSAGGTWSSSNTAVAAIGSSSGLISAIIAGTSTIAYTDLCGHVVTKVLTVNPNPNAISGGTTVCVAGTITLSDATTGGTWSSGNPAVATVGSLTGVVTGVTPGTAYIYYILTATGCQVRLLVTVISPGTITGNHSVCVGASTVLSDLVGGGTWSSSSSSVATVSSTGTVTGVAAGTATISYVIPPGCVAMFIVTINPLPAAITYTTTAICVGQTTTLSDATPGGTWSSGNTAIATVGSLTGVVTGVATGFVTISYVLTATGCSVSVVIDVLLTPSPIVGTGIVCVGSTINLTDGVAGGTWVSGNTAVATIGSSTGVVSGLTPGTATIVYTLSFDGCSTSTVVTVDPLPVAFSGGIVCVGQSITLTDATLGGSWSSSYTTVTVGSGTGIVTGVSTGTAVITYKLITGCFTTAVVTVDPTMGPITGSLPVCAGLTTLLSDATAGGTWSSSNIAVGTVGSASGILTGISGGTTTITYSVGVGCYATITASVEAAATPIFGLATVCVGKTTSLSDGTPGGTWSSGSPGIATIGSATGMVTGISPGTAIISYTVSAICPVIEDTVTVLPIPGPINGAGTVCVGSTITLTDTSGGGTWSSGSPIIAIVGTSSGIVTGMSAGTVVITYTIPNGCSITTIVTVNPSLPITGGDSVCVGSTINLGDGVPGGIWISSVPGVGTIGSLSGVVTGISPGTTIISYILSTGCIRTRVETVNPVPAAITGPDSVCVGSVITLSDADLFGTWSPGSPIVLVNPLTGAVTGVGAGVAVISYTFSTGCYATYLVTVNPLPIPILVPSPLCVGVTDTLIDFSSGGTWAIDTTGVTVIVATIDLTTGAITGVSAGTATVIYTLPTGCKTSVIVTINLSPAIITGADSVCAGSVIMLSDSISGGHWGSSDLTVAIIDAMGNVTGETIGTVIITYTLPSGCYTTDTITVDSLSAIPSIIGIPCATPGCEFPRPNPRNPRDPANQIVTALTSGQYGSITVNGGITSFGTNLPNNGGVNQAPAAFPCVCIGSTTPLSDSLAGGTWTSGDTSIATVDSSSGVVTGVSPGIVMIGYNVNNRCGTATIFTFVVVEGPPTVSVITGVLGVCSGFTTQLFDSVSCGVWSTNDTSLITVDSATGIVTGISAGSATVTYTVTNACGSAADSIMVLVDQPPYITTNFIVACQTLSSGSDGTGGHGSVIPDTACIRVCDSSIVRYYANGNAGAMFTWQVVGGIVIDSFLSPHDSIDILWPTVGTTGSLTLYDTLAHCTGKAMACIKVISKPHANISVISTSVCLGQSVQFDGSASTADSSSAIVSYYWNFGDGGSSSTVLPSHTFSVTGTYTVTLTVKNSCGCSDSIKVVITVSPYNGPAITCASIVCDSQRAIYSTVPDDCGIYNWSVIGGTIVRGDNSTPSITVQWNNVGPGGFGYVSLAEPCADCTDTITIKVPVILQSPAIKGPSVLCANQQYQFSLPLWAATQYKWGVIGHHETIVGYDDNNIVTLMFNTPGIYRIHGWYQNRIALCGASVDTTITVVAPTAIIGPATICSGNSATYTLADTTLSATWSLYFDTTAVFIGSVTGTSATIPALVPPGTYLVTANGNFCAEPLTVHVLPALAPIDSVTGLDTVCLGRAYSYTAWSDVPGTIYSWQAIGGTVSPASGSNLVTVVWTSSGTKQLLVSRMMTIPPYCTGPVDTVAILQEVIDPNITGDTVPCANTYKIYNAHYSRGDDYNWTIIPNSAGSVVLGNYTPQISVLWNNVATVTSVQIILKVKKCDTTVIDTFNVNVQPSPGLTITAAPDPACPGFPVVFTTASGGETYYWDFGDGTAIFIPATSGYTSPPHSFPLNLTTGNMSYVVKVGISADIYALCPVSGLATYNMTILPGPWAVASSASLCPGPMTGTVTSNVGGLTYQWYENGSAISGAVSSTYTSTTEDDYNFVVIAGNGCSDTSNTIGVGCESFSGGSCTPTSTVTGTCGTVSLSGQTTGFSMAWKFVDGPSSPIGGIIPDSGAVATATFDVPGIYWFQYFDSLGDTCGVGRGIILADTVGIIVDFRYELQCGNSGTDSVFFTDYSTYLPWLSYLGSGVTWYDGTTYLGAGYTVRVSLTTATPHDIKEVVTGTDPSGTFTCDRTKTISLPGEPPPGVSFTGAPSTICEGVPITFNATGSGLPLQYYWDFGDSAASVLQNTQRTYKWKPTANPQTYTVTLTVTDTIGCTATDTQTVHIYQNNLSGNYFGNHSICSSAAPDTITFFNSTLPSSAPYTYLWNNLEMGNTDTVSKSGTYWVTVIDVNQCQFTRLPGLNVTVVTPPAPQIYGLVNYCIGEVVNLSGFAGSAVTYAWLRNGSADGVTYSVADADTPGSYLYQLVLGVTDSSGLTCYDTGSQIVHVYPLPPTPTVTGPTPVDCNTYHLVLTASVPSPWAGIFNWSNGVTGATNDIYAGGPYRVWFKDLWGCVSDTDVYVPLAPDTWFPYFPTGCYSLCQQQLPITLFGPPDSTFNYWAWLENGDTVSSSYSTGAGSGTRMGSYTIDSAGDYQWYLDNGLCGQMSDTLAISVVNCNNCQGDSVVINSFVCDTANPAAYAVTLTMYSPGAGYAYTIGTDIGPIDPFSGLLTSYGAQPPMTLAFTTLVVPPATHPDSITIQVMFTDTGSGNRCFYKRRVALPDCPWSSSERHGHPPADTTVHGDNSPVLKISAALLVFPNPASGNATVSYDYGNEGANQRELTVYDQLGRKVASYTPQTTHGSWNLNTMNWMPGVYIIRMEGDGNAIQTQRIVISH